MDNREYIINLYEYYKNLLTDKQREYFEDYYFENLTLAEISENDQISRNAVHKQIKEVEEKLYDYENKLHLKERNEKIKERLSNYDKKLRDEIDEWL